MSQRRHDRRAAMCKRHADALAIAAGACNPSSHGKLSRRVVLMEPPELIANE